jgi:hypothetical protein
VLDPSARPLATDLYPPTHPQMVRKVGQTEPKIQVHQAPIMLGPGLWAAPVSAPHLLRGGAHNDFRRMQ